MPEAETLTQLTFGSVAAVEHFNPSKNIGLSGNKPLSLRTG